MDKDFLLIRKIKNGEEAAMDAFVKKYYPVIFRYCNYHISDVGYAEDMVQETFLRFFRSLSNYRHTGKALNFLYRIAGNLCKDFYRKNIEYTLSEEIKIEGNQMDDVEKKIDMERVLQRLPEEFRDVIILYYFQGLKLKEIAEIQKIGLSLVKYRMKKGREQLKDFLGEEENV